MITKKMITKKTIEEFMELHNKYYEITKNLEEHMSFYKNECHLSIQGVFQYSKLLDCKLTFIRESDGGNAEITFTTESGFRFFAIANPYEVNRYFPNNAKHILSGLNKDEKEELLKELQRK